MTDEELAALRIMRIDFYWISVDDMRKRFLTREEAVAAELAWLKSDAEERKENDKQ